MPKPKWCDSVAAVTGWRLGLERFSFSCGGAGSFCMHARPFAAPQSGPAAGLEAWPDARACVVSPVPLRRCLCYGFDCSSTRRLESRHWNLLKGLPLSRALRTEPRPRPEARWAGARRPRICPVPSVCTRPSSSSEKAMAATLRAGQRAWAARKVLKLLS